MFKLGEKGEKLIKSYESLVLTSYPDPYSPLGKALRAKKIKLWEYEKLPNWQSLSGAPWTIGWGHTKGVKSGQKISIEQAQGFFADDTKDAINAVNQGVKVSINQNQFDALVSFTFNCGVGAFLGSSLLRHLNAKSFDAAAKEFAKWNKSGGVISNGLIARRANEAQLFRTTTNA